MLGRRIWAAPSSAERNRRPNASPTTPPSALHPDRKSTRLNSSHGYISYAVFCLKKKKTTRLHRPLIPKHPANQTSHELPLNNHLLAASRNQIHTTDTSHRRLLCAHQCARILPVH